MTQITGSLVVGPDGTQFATLFVPGGEPPIYTVPGDHPNFAADRGRDPGFAR